MRKSDAGTPFSRSDTLHTIGCFLKLMSAIIVHVHVLLLMLGLGEWGPSLAELQLILNSILLWLVGWPFDDRGGSLRVCPCQTS